MFRSLVRAQESTNSNKDFSPTTRQARFFVFLFVFFGIPPKTDAREKNVFRQFSSNFVQVSMTFSRDFAEHSKAVQNLEFEFSE